MEKEMDSGINTYVTCGHILSSLGKTTSENMEKLMSQQTGILLHQDNKISDFPFMGGIIEPFHTGEQMNEYTRLEQIFIVSLQQVIDNSGIDPTACALILSTTKGNIDHLPEAMDKTFLSRIGKVLCNYFNIPHSPIIISTACISGVSALIIGSRLIKAGNYKHILICGGDLLTRFVLSGFQSFKSVSEQVCKPYDKERDGLSLGEAVGSLLMTVDKKYVKEKTPVILESGAITNDANHISGPSRTGDGLYYAIANTMQQAGINTEEVSFINTHGTATPYNDEMESKAIKWAGLEHKPLNSLKSAWGHTLGASGIVETIACMEQLQMGKIAGTYNYKESGVPFPLQVSPFPQSFDGGRCIKTASGFGGCNAALSLALEPFVHYSSIVDSSICIEKKHSCIIKDNRILLNGNLVFSGEKKGDFGSFIRSAYKYISLDNRKFYKMDDLCKLGYIAAAVILDQKDLSHFSEQEIGIILSNRSSSLDTDKKHQDTIDKLGEKEASPAIFVYTLPNVILGELCIRYKIQGENTFFITEKYEDEFICNYTRVAMEKQNMSACLTGWCELLDNEYEACFEWWERI